MTGGRAAALTAANRLVLGDPPRDPPERRGFPNDLR